MKIATWKIPESFSADRNVSMTCRIKHYRFDMNHFLIDNTQIVPTVQTTKNVLYSYDFFSAVLAVDENSYVKHTEFNSAP